MFKILYYHHLYLHLYHVPHRQLYYVMFTYCSYLSRSVPNVLHGVVYVVIPLVKLIPTLKLYLNDICNDI